MTSLPPASERDAFTVDHASHSNLSFDRVMQTFGTFAPVVIKL